MYAYSVTYIVRENEQVYKRGTMGVKHIKKCTPTDFKRFIKSMLPITKRRLPIEIVQFENISEEECSRQFGNEVFSP